MLQSAGRPLVALLAALGERAGLAAREGKAMRDFLELALSIISQTCVALLWGYGRTPRAAAAVRGWPLYALLVFAVGQLSAGEPPGPTYGLPAELVAEAARVYSARHADSPLKPVPGWALVYAFSTADVQTDGVSRRGLLLVTIRMGRRAMAADAARRAAGSALCPEHCYTAVAAVCAAGNLLRGCALEAQWQQQALADAWRLAQDAAAAGLLQRGALPVCQALSYTHGLCCAGAAPGS